jgi:hypothetical protein
VDFKPFEGKADAGAVMTVMHPGTGRPTDARITLAGTDSKLWRNALSELRHNALQGADKADNALIYAARKVSEDRTLLIASVTLEWENVELEGKLLACTRENAKNLYERFRWLFEQVDSFVTDRSNFFRSVGASTPEGDEVEGETAAPAEGE